MSLPILPCCGCFTYGFESPDSGSISVTLSGFSDNPTCACLTDFNNSSSCTDSDVNGMHTVSITPDSGALCSGWGGSANIGTIFITNFSDQNCQNDPISDTNTLYISIACLDGSGINLSVGNCFYQGPVGGGSLSFVENIGCNTGAGCLNCGSVTIS